ncbi:MAG: carboxylating nicotinate-nucleotide diphosphorylase [Pseudomonadales bacterium]|nr:carboxylating nicotinate-nucleotide diphosphorylase [Pseudomonadales bacterium]
MDHETQASLTSVVDAAIAEDLGSGDLTAQLIPEQAQATATLICRDEAVIAGIPWAERVFKTIDPNLCLEWLIDEGARVKAGTTILTCSGNARSILTAERTALNFLQTLSATATATRALVDTITHTKAQLLDTRKTLPGLRLAQKYAVLQGGGLNHRIGLYDAFLIKENHILAAGGIGAAITRARKLAPATRLEIEVESLAELKVAIVGEPDWIMLDNFPLEELIRAVKLTPDTIKLEASGGIETPEDLIRIAETGVDYISVGALTKHCRAVDLSLRLEADD